MSVLAAPPPAFLWELSDKDWFWPVVVGAIVLGTISLVTTHAIRRALPNLVKQNQAGLQQISTRLREIGSKADDARQRVEALDRDLKSKEREAKLVGIAQTILGTVVGLTAGFFSDDISDLGTGASLVAIVVGLVLVVGGPSFVVWVAAAFSSGRPETESRESGRRAR